MELKAHLNILPSFFQIFAAVVATAVALPLEDTMEVAQAKKEFMAAFEAAEAGKHSELAPKPVVTEYLADAEDVKMAKEQFMKAFETAKEMKIAPQVTTTYNAALPAIAPYTAAYAAPYWNAATYAAPYWNQWNAATYAAPYWNQWNAATYYNWA